MVDELGRIRESRSTETLTSIEQTSKSQGATPTTSSGEIESKDENQSQSTSSRSNSSSSCSSSPSKEWSNLSHSHHHNQSSSPSEQTDGSGWLRSGIRTAPIQVISSNKSVNNGNPDSNGQVDLSGMVDENVFQSDEIQDDEDDDDGLWQDETDSEQEEEDSHQHISIHDDQQRLIKPERGKDETSYKEALRQYKRSRRALLLSENGMSYENDRDQDGGYTEEVLSNGHRENNSLKEIGNEEKGVGARNGRNGKDRENHTSPPTSHSISISPNSSTNQLKSRSSSENRFQTHHQVRSSNSRSDLKSTSTKHPSTSTSKSIDLNSLDFSNLPRRRSSNYSNDSHSHAHAAPSTPKLLYASVPGTPEIEESNTLEEEGPTLISPLFSSSRRTSEQSNTKSSSNDHTKSGAERTSTTTIANGLLSPNLNRFNSQEADISPKNSPTSFPNDLTPINSPSLRKTSSKELRKTPFNQTSKEGEKPDLSSISHQKSASKQLNTPNLNEVLMSSRKLSDSSNINNNNNSRRIEKERERGIAAGAVHSLWDYLREEILATDFDSTQELKWERVTNFMAIPFWMEKIMIFGFAVCLDSFLYTFTILPLRFAVAIYSWISNTLNWLLKGQKTHLHSSHKCDILKTLLIIFACYILSRITDTSKMYHSVRGQDVVKLYVIFNVLEIADRLCCSFGQDLLDSLFSRITLARRKDGSQPYLRPFGFFLLSLAYILAHTLVLLYQLVTLNVAINSYDNALLTLLLSNQFVEIKGSVFKKFEKENLFQLTCADIVERFQLTLMLSCIGLRNLIEVSGGSSSSDGIKVTSSGPLPTSFTVFPSLTLIETIISPVLIVLLSECIVDWLKHAFITKFNHIRPSIYGRFMDVLCRDLVIAGPGRKEQARKHTFVDQSPIVSRRLGFAALPLACLLVRVSSQIFNMLADTSHFDECAMPGAHELRGGLGFAKITARGLGQEDNGFLLWILELSWRGAAWALTVLIGWVS